MGNHQNSDDKKKHDEDLEKAARDAAQQNQPLKKSASDPGEPKPHPPGQDGGTGGDRR